MHPGVRNPYLNRVMIRETSQFYGRRREVAKILARIGASRPQSVAIVGERRIGKSSLLNYLCQPEVRRKHLDAPDAYTFVFIDLQEQREIGVGAFFESLFGGIEKAIGQVRPEGLTADYEGARHALVRFQEEGRKVILLFDEFDAITRNPNFPEEFFAFLRAVANKYDVAYVTTSGRDLQQLCHTERIADSPFFNIFSNLFLTRFERDEALDLIRTPSAAAGVPLEPHAADIIDMAGLFPFFLQIACASCFEQLAEHSRLDVGRARESFLEEAEPHFNYLCDHLDDDQRGVLLDLAEGRAVGPNRSYLLSRLQREGYLLEEGGRQRLFSSVFASCILGGRLRHAASHAPAARRPVAEPSRPADYPLKAGDSISHFRILGPLGAGGMSLLFTAEDERLRRVVALKVLPPEVVSDADRKRRFLHEARAASVLNHPNIAVVYEADEVGGISFIAMEYVEGKTLRERLSYGPVPLSEVLSIGAQVADALAAAHEQKIVHRDIKPENIMIARGGRVKVVDFGIAKLLEHLTTFNTTLAYHSVLDRTSPGVTLGTLAYMSPEQAKGDIVDHRSDIFSVGAVLWEMVTGQPPFGGATGIDRLYAILHYPARAQDLAGTAPSSLQQIICRALEKDPRDRYQTMIELAGDLRRIEGTPARPPAPAATTMTDRLRKWLKL